jgi:hypothetical protein
MHYFIIIIIIIILLSTLTRPQPPASTASHHSQQHNHRNHILTHCKTHHKPTKPNHNFNKTPPPATTDQQISTARERNRSHSEPRWASENVAQRDRPQIGEAQHHREAYCEAHAPPRSCTTARPPPDLQDDAGAAPP